MENGSLLEQKVLRIIAKILIVMFGTSLASVFLGILLPFFSWAMGIFEDPGLGGVVLIFFGLLLGLMYGGISFTVSTVRSKRLFSRYVALNLIVLTVLSLAVIICWIAMPERFAHI